MIRSFLGLLFTVVGVVTSVAAQTAPSRTSIPAGVPVKEVSLESKGGVVEGRTYTNRLVGIRFTVPDDWFIAGSDFERIAKTNGHDLALTSGSAGPRAVDILVTAFRSDPAGGAVLRVTTEDLTAHTQIRDAVDYFDAVTAAYSGAKLPADFSYSSTKAERLGRYQLAYLDTASSTGKKRMYATVKGRKAIMFVLSYVRDEDLAFLRNLLEKAELVLN